MIKDIENGLLLRNFYRWNGRDVRDKENGAEHVHLAVICVLHLYDEFKEHIELNIERLIRATLFIDDFILIYGEINELTKQFDKSFVEKYDFAKKEMIMDKVKNITENEIQLVDIAHKMATYKFIEFQLRYPNNDFLIDAYIQTKNTFEKMYNGLKNEFITENCVKSEYSFVKGYIDDAGVDVILKEKVTFMPLHTSKINLHVTCTPEVEQMSYLCARTSAAAKGLIVAQCPIDPNFTGEITAVVHNVSNKIIEYDVGEAFCQIVSVPIVSPGIDDEILIKKDGVRTTGKLGSTGGVKC